MKNPDRLYQLLPVVYRSRDAGQGYPLQALLRVIGEQVEVVEGDIDQLYENWFIETCEEWAVPYLGDLIGYQVLNQAGEPQDVTTAQEQNRERVLIPRRDVANTIHARRRKGTLALLEELARDVAGWPARAVEFYHLLSWTQNLRSPRLGQPIYHTARIGDTVASLAARYQITAERLLWLNPAAQPEAAVGPGTRWLLGWRQARGRTAGVRDAGALGLLGGAFDQLARTVEVRRIDSHRTPGRYNLPSVGVFVWRLKSYSVSWTGMGQGVPKPQPGGTPANCLEEQGPQCYTFSVLGNDSPLFNRPQPEKQPTEIAGELNLPTPIGRLGFAKRPADYYGLTKSLAIWAPNWPAKGGGMPIPASAVVAAELGGWHYRAARDHILVDPESGRIVFPVNQLPKQGVSVYYHYAFSADIGGGEYDRPVTQPADAKLYRVGPGGDFESISKALEKWASEKQLRHGDPGPGENPPALAAVIELTDSGVYTEQFKLTLDANESLQIRAARRTRPVVRLLDYAPDQPDALSITGSRGSRLTLDGLLVTGRGLVVQGPAPDSENAPGGSDDLCDVTIRHCTLVPGWGLHCDCEPRRPAEPSLELFNSTAHIKIEHSIIGAIEVTADAAATDPVRIEVSDTIWDATSVEKQALRGPDGGIAYALLSIARATVLGEIATHAIALAENSIFAGCVCVARRQQGCVRFCYVAPGSRTPRRYECQPDLVLQAIQDKLAGGEIFLDELEAGIETEQLRVEPEFNSTRYGTPTYCQLADTCAEEITRGADDESEVGAFHDLYQPQRADNLRARLEEFTPAGMDAGIINAT